MPLVALAALEAATLSESGRFRAAILEMADSEVPEGTEENIAVSFVAQVSAVVGPEPSVGDLVLLSKALWPHVSKVMDVTPYDIEFLLRGFAGAETLMKAIPREIAVALMIACMGALQGVPAIELGSQCWDGGI